MDRGKQILFSMYWSGGHWKKCNVPDEDLAYAKNAGYLFNPPEYETHDSVLLKLKMILDNIDPKDISNAFLYSLSTGKLEYRSAFGSYYYAKAIPEHEIDCQHSPHCYLCGWNARNSKQDVYENEYNIFSFERYKWGGVRHTSIDYALFDLEQFLKLPKVVPSEDDKSLLIQLLHCVKKLAPHNKAGALRTQIEKERIIKSTKDELTVLLEVLGICGILASRNYPGYEAFFTDEYGRAPTEHANDMAYPLNRWRAEDGINTKRFTEIFGFAFPD